LENVFGEPGIDGIQSAMTSMFDAWHQLSVNPADEGSRLNVRMTASLLVSRVRDAHNQMVGNVVRLQNEATDTIRDINQLAEGIVRLNAEIRQEAASGAQPNDLMDQRDLLLRRLSELVDIRTQVMPDQTISVFINQHTLVNPVEANPLPLTFDAATSTITDGSKSILIRGGRLAGIFGAINANNMYSTRLDQLVDDVRTQVNTIHAAGINLNGNTGIGFFAGSAGAGDLDLDPAILADIRNIAAGVSGETGDGGLAQSISAIRDLPSPALGGRSVLSYYADMISTLGQDAKSAGNSVETQAAVLTQLETQQQAISGVNIDEEMATMMRYQRSFQAAAKLLSVLDQTTEELIKSFGR
jgi:flagellar hook-associated protein 1 FlgK